VMMAQRLAGVVLLHQSEISSLRFEISKAITLPLVPALQLPMEC